MFLTVLLPCLVAAVAVTNRATLVQTNGEWDDNIQGVRMPTGQTLTADFVCKDQCSSQELNTNQTFVQFSKYNEDGNSFTVSLLSQSAGLVTLTQGAEHLLSVMFQPRLKQLKAAPTCYNNTAAPYNCPNTQLCVPDYQWCKYINATCNATKPFRCSNGCQSAMGPQCCSNTTTWCPHTNKCVSNATTCCSLNPLTPIYCQATKKCVQHEWQCCSNFLSNTVPMVKCYNEPKCAPTNTVLYCFSAIAKTCTGEFNVQCPYDGTCKRNLSECQSPRVCPPMHYMCQDGTCLPGLAQQQKCNSLPTCLIGGVQYLRCSDGLTCVESYDKCPSLVSCLDPTQVVCPDGKCAASSSQCIKPPALRSFSSCGPNSIRCPDGQCKSSCTNHTNNCNQIGMVTCPSGDCATHYDRCVDQTICPLVRNYTTAASAVQCGYGPQICTWDSSRCHNQQCNGGSSPCADGRCQSKCLTEISCSPGYLKFGGLGILCLKESQFAEQITGLALQLSALTCPDHFVTCLTGECRQTPYDCPQATTCPASQPIKCLNGACVTSKSNCTAIDTVASQNAQNCFNRGLLLCQSDLLTCVQSLDLCPTLSTCKPGFVKCSESSCVPSGQTCPEIPICTSDAPFFCRITQTCVSNHTQCFPIPKCPSSSPVKCASDGNCKISIHMCGSNTSKPAVTTLCSQFSCADGSCRSDFCPEWLSCPASQVQCPTGPCVSDLKLCPLSSNGCSFDLPVFCNFTATCEKNSTRCLAFTTARTNLNNICKSKFPSSPLGCRLGNCVADPQKQCTASFTTQCFDHLYPNSIRFSTPTLNITRCYVPQCPPTQPYKCPNGLCVNSQVQCPTPSYGVQSVQYCQQMSKIYGLDIQVPCGDGTCRSSIDQCIPLYPCSANSALNETVRCGDGTCAKQASDCPQQAQKCPSHIPFMCKTGQCAAQKSECFINNGCPEATPYYCDQTGGCMKDGTTCFSQYNLLQRMNKNASSTFNICTKQGKVSCFTQDLMYCAATLDQCYQVFNGCPATAPISCQGKCVNDSADCKIYSTTPPTPVDSTTTNHQGCPFATPFRCNNQSFQACQVLPYSTDWRLDSQTCSVTPPKVATGWQVNSCQSQMTPFSCLDGSCVAKASECQTCPYFCTTSNSCTASVNDCTNTRTYPQVCPSGTPIRCIADGRCVQNGVECTLKMGMSLGLPDLEFKGILLDSNCPNSNPIRCISGQCVRHYSHCLINVPYDSLVLQNPIAWKEQGTVPTACAAYCTDGSCRDRQENCPLIQACVTTSKPYRCMSGFCAASQAECVDKYGKAAEQEQARQPSTSCQTEMGKSKVYYRCEDGTCRPKPSSCLQFLGCPLSEPLQCPTGHCVKTVADCLKFSHPFCKGKYMCKNMSCVSDPSQCFVDYLSLPTPQIEANLDPYVDNTIDVAFIYDRSVGRLVLPSNSIKVTESQIKQMQDTIQRITVYPVLTKEISQYQNILNSTEAQDYLNKFYPLVNNALPPLESLFFPVINITNANSTSQTLRNARFDFKLNHPSSVDLRSDLCLARVTNQTFNCVSRDLSQNNDWYSLPIQQTGVYALIFNPDMTLKTVPVVPPKPTETSHNGSTEIPPSQNITTEIEDICESFLCKNKKWIIIGGSVGGGLLLIATVTSVICCCVKKKPVEIDQKKVPLNQPASDREPSNQKKETKKKKADSDQEATYSNLNAQSTAKKVAPKEEQSTSATPVRKPPRKRRRDSDSD